jgi:hypothetical protein
MEKRKNRLGAGNNTSERNVNIGHATSRGGAGGGDEFRNIVKTGLTPIGWAGCSLFNFDQILRAGHLRLKMFDGDCTPELAMVAPLLNNTTSIDVNMIELEFPEFDKPVIYTDHREKSDTRAQVGFVSLWNCQCVFEFLSRLALLSLCLCLLNECQFLLDLDN